MKAFMLQFHSLLKSAMQEILGDLTESNMQCRDAGMSSIELLLPLLHGSDAAELINRADGSTGI